MKVREKSIKLVIFHVEINTLNKSTYINQMLWNGRLQCLNKCRLLLIIYNAVNSRMGTLNHGGVNIIPCLADCETACLFDPLLTDNKDHT